MARLILHLCIISSSSLLWALSTSVHGDKCDFTEAGAACSSRDIGKQKQQEITVAGPALVQVYKHKQTSVSHEDGLTEQEGTEATACVDTWLYTCADLPKDINGKLLCNYLYNYYWEDRNGVKAKDGCCICNGGIQTPAPPSPVPTPTLRADCNAEGGCVDGDWRNSFGHTCADLREYSGGGGADWTDSKGSKAGVACCQFCAKKCCWNRLIQSCSTASDCDQGGEGCIDSGTDTEEYGQIQCNTCESQGKKYQNYACV